MESTQAAFRYFGADGASTWSFKREGFPAVRCPPGSPSQEIADSVASLKAFQLSSKRFVTPLLAQAYAEGAPLHPSFPAAHAEIAGACVTILKAFTEPSFRFPNTVCVSRDGLDRRKFDGDLTLEGELNKLAWNMAFGRSFAGVHYRSDLEFGLALGENIGLQLLSELNKDVVASPSTLWFRRFDGSQTSIVV